ncbi:MAG TPA: hypothetical protein VF613_01480 [Longimicrobium sp.]
MNTTARFVHVPAELFSTVRRALVRDREPMEAVTLLREVGFELGGAVDSGLRQHVTGATGVDPYALEPDRFWRTASGYFEGLGWGRLEHQRVHPGVGALDLVEWIENGADGGPQGSHISTGIFTDLLGRIAGGAVVVMEVPVDAGRTRLLFGAGETLGAVYQSLSTGASLDQALASLG